MPPPEMDIDSTGKYESKKKPRIGRKVQKRKPSRIVFPKYKDRKPGKAKGKR